MAQTIAVCSIKGGVGKTTLAVNLAYCGAAQASRRTLLWDIDARGAALSLCAGKHSGAAARRVFAREVEPLEWAERPNRLRKLLERMLVERSPVMDFASNSTGSQPIGDLWSRIEEVPSAIPNSHLNPAAKFPPDVQATRA